MALPIDRINTKDIFTDEVTNLLNSFPVHIYFNIRGKLLMIDTSELLYLPHCLLGMLFIQGFGPLLKNEGGTPDTCLKCHLIDPAACSWLLDIYLRLFLKNTNYSPYKIKEDPLNDTTFVFLLVEFCDIYVISKKTHQGVNPSVKEKLLELYYKNNNIFETSPKSLFFGNKKERSAFVHLLNECGFGKDEKWSRRVKEPKRMSLSSYHVTTLRCTAENADLCERQLRFWRTPGHKCWWFENMHNFDNTALNVWRRKFWTLELSITGQSVSS
ncbi:G-patch RNA-binding protein, involved in splicing [Schizosaccharomyces osmophilus]|uniref:G-patch RNA-binding protein, involved in splicing n=1 Tax=Schizosaccharomyces osmophilus TaxID=2545709 RepID=A0AAE9WF37_9SCHI|nr:G-patch RNA-binding protein, involved in splicing [Schizosaccharomyces osmophilus]WBW74106.1 G-patch RNA-binding protein, involved in splicing [Schizosaccharomyces osmophilus]